MPRSSVRQIVICDDKAPMQQMYIQALSPLPGCTTKVISHPDQLLATLDGCANPAVLLMDLQFPITPDSDQMATIGHQWLPEVRCRFPSTKVIVVTALGPDVYRLVLECQRKRLHDDWLDVGKHFKVEEIRARVEALLYPLGTVSERGLWMLHLSDLHFGDTARYGYWGLAEDGALLDAIQRDLGETFPREKREGYSAIDLVAVTGDVANRGRDGEFSKASALFRGLLSGCRPPASAGRRAADDPRLLVVPGNHDANWDISRARAVFGTAKRLKYNELRDAADIPEELTYLRRYLWAPFEEFLKQTGAAHPDIAQLWNKERGFGGAKWMYPELGAVIYGFNTSAEAVDHFQNKPQIPRHVLSELSSGNLNLGTTNAEPCLLPPIALTHHSLGSIGSARERIDETTLAEVRVALKAKLGCRVFLTGHVHKNVAETVSVDNEALLFISSGTTSAASSHREDMDPLHYNIIRFMPSSQAGRESATVTIYPRIGLKNGFFMNPEHPCIVYSWDDAAGWSCRAS